MDKIKIGTLSLIFCILLGLFNNFAKEHIVFVLVVVIALFRIQIEILEKRIVDLEKRCDAFWIHIQEKMGR